MSDIHPRKSYTSEYEALLDHPFFHDIERTDIPLMEELKAEHFEEMPTLYEAYQHETDSVMIQELLFPADEGDEELTLIAYHFKGRFVMIQNIKTLDCGKFNMLALWEAETPFSRAVHANFTECQRIASTAAGRKVLASKGFKFDRPQKPRGK